MKAKNLDLQTCEGRFSLHNVNYHFMQNDLLEIHVSFSIFDRDQETQNAIIKTQLMTGREFSKTETENGFYFVFTYPYSLICGLYQ